MTSTELCAELRRKHEHWALGQKGPQILLDAAALLESQANALRKMEAKFDITKRQKNYQKDRATKANASRADIADGLDHSKARAPLRGTFRHRSENDERPSRRPRV